MPPDEWVCPCAICTSQDERREAVLNDNWSWDYDTCDYQDCGELATHRLYVADELRRHLCADHASELAAEHAWFWHDVAAAIAAADHAAPQEGVPS